MDRISEHISYGEATRSQYAERHKIKNEPTETELENMKTVALVCFEPIREWWDKPLTISSFYRCKDLNTAIKGSATSQHVTGKAIDIDTGNNADNKLIYDWAKANLKYDQLIWEYGDESGPSWVHISYDSKYNRNQTLKIS